MEYIEQKSICESLVEREQDLSALYLLSSGTQITFLNFHNHAPIWNLGPSEFSLWRVYLCNLTYKKGSDVRSRTIRLSTSYCTPQKWKFLSKLSGWENYSSLPTTFPKHVDMHLTSRQQKALDREFLENCFEPEDNKQHFHYSVWEKRRRGYLLDYFICRLPHVVIKYQGKENDEFEPGLTDKKVKLSFHLYSKQVLYSTPWVMWMLARIALPKIEDQMLAITYWVVK